MSIFKDLLDPQHRRRRLKHPVEYTDVEAAEALQPQKQLAVLLREVSGKISEHLGQLALAQQKLMQGLQEYLGVVDITGVDVAAMALVQECASAIEHFEACLKEAALPEMQKACEEVVLECENLLSLRQDRDNALRERQHYEEKLVDLQSARPGVITEQISRNLEKLDRAKMSLESQERKLATQLRVFMYRRPVHFRQMFLALFRKYLGFWTQTAKHSEKALELIKADLHVGSSAQIVGLQRAVELNGLEVVVVEEEEGGRRLLVELPDGDQKSVRVENLCPLHHDPLHLEDVDAAAPSAPPATEVGVDPAEAKEERRSQLHVEPSRVATCGGEAELEVDGLAGPISEVLANGVACEVLSRFERSGRQGAQVQIPAASDLAGGAVELEVRSASWQRHLIRETALTYFPLMSFMACGSNIELTSRKGVQPDVATRKKGLISAVVVTSELKPCGPQGGDVSEEQGQRFYFEVLVDALSEKRTNRTLALGFVWQLPQALLLGPETGRKRPAALWAPDGQMPEQALQLPRSLVLGGDPPKAYLAGKEVAKLSWRPLLEVTLKNVLGVLLEMTADHLSISIFQDGDLKCTVEAPVPEDAGLWC
eukprot:s1104_g2.t1